VMERIIVLRYYGMKTLKSLLSFRRNLYPLIVTNTRLFQVVPGLRP
jgi:hypothetical protein